MIKFNERLTIKKGVKENEKKRMKRRNPNQFLGPLYTNSKLLTSKLMKTAAKKNHMHCLPYRRVGWLNNEPIFESASDSGKMSILLVAIAESAIPLLPLTPSWLWFPKNDFLFFIGRRVVEACAHTSADSACDIAGLVITCKT